MILRFRHFILCALFSGVLCLAGCVTMVDGPELVRQQEEELSRHRDAAAMPSALQFRALNFGEPLTFELSEFSQVMEFDGEYSFVMAFELPVWTEPQVINVASFRTGPSTSPAIIYPAIQFLDANFSEIRRSAHQQFVYRRAGFQSGDGLYATFFINDSHRSVRYIVVSAPRSSVSARVRVSEQSVTMTPIMVPVSGGVVTYFAPLRGSSFESHLTPAAMGKMQIEAQIYQPGIIEAK